MKHPLELIQRKLLCNQPKPITLIKHSVKYIYASKGLILFKRCPLSLRRHPSGWDLLYCVIELRLLLFQSDVISPFRSKIFLSLSKIHQTLRAKNSWKSFSSGKMICVAVLPSVPIDVNIQCSLLMWLMLLLADMQLPFYISGCGVKFQKGVWLQFTYGMDLTQKYESCIRC